MCRRMAASVPTRLPGAPRLRLPLRAHWSRPQRERLPGSATERRILRRVGAPDLVELLLIKRQQPALGDPSAPEAVEPNRRPTAFLATEHGRAVSKHGDVIAIPDQHLPWVQPEGS